MKEGYLGNLFRVHPPKDELTVSSALLRSPSLSVSYFSLGKGTDISPESYPDFTLLLCLGGNLEVISSGYSKKLNPLETVLFKPGEFLGRNSQRGCGYIQFTIGGNCNMKCSIQAGEVFSLKNLVSYEEGRIVNKDLLSNEKRKLALLAFDEGQELSPHRAKGNALLFILDGKGLITYEGKEFLVKEGDEFCFAKDGLHAVKALTKFKMALLLALD